jgi:predicted acetyltransferase
LSFSHEKHAPIALSAMIMFHVECRNVADGLNLGAYLLEISMRLVHRSTSGKLPTSTYDLVSDAGDVLGFCQLRHRPSCAADLPAGAENSIYYEVAKAYRGRGYGKQLMGLALAEARRIGLETVRISVDDDNPTSRHIVETHGAVWVATVERKDGGLCHLFEIILAATRTRAASR